MHSAIDIAILSFRLSVCHTPVLRLNLDQEVFTIGLHHPSFLRCKVRLKIRIVDGMVMKNSTNTLKQSIYTRAQVKCVSRDTFGWLGGVVIRASDL